MNLKRTLILIRHAHRDNTDRDLDNGLSEQGHEQARKVQKELLELIGDREVKILSSPKQRCVETVEPLAKKLDVEVEIHDDLKEQTADESDREFRARVKLFCDYWRHFGTEITVACSHGDFLPLCVYELIGEEYVFKKSEYIEIKLTLKA